MSRRDSTYSLESVTDLAQVASGPDRVIPASDYVSWEPEQPVKLRMPDSTFFHHGSMNGSAPVGTGSFRNPLLKDLDDAIASRNPLSLPTIIRRSCVAGEDLSAMSIKRNGVWQTWSYKRYYAEIKAIARGFIKMGLKPFHSVCVLAHNCPEWFIAELATIFAQGMACGLYTTNKPETNKHILNDSRAQIVICEDQAAVDKILALKPDLQYMTKIVQVLEDVVAEDPDVISWDELLQFGQELEDGPLFARLENMACCLLIYTSGTTGSPKGVMLSHDNIASECFMLLKKFEPYLEVDEEVMMSYLPLNHVAAQMVELWIPLILQTHVYFADPDALKGSLLKTLREVRPTVMLAVPRIWEKVVEGVAPKLEEAKGFKRTLVNLCREAALEMHLTGRKGLTYRILGNDILYSKVKGSLGLDRCKMFLTGAAPVSEKVLKFLMSLDIQLCDIYGLSETTAAMTVNTPQTHRIGSIGFNLPGGVTIIDKPDAQGRGELMAWGRHVMMGYLNQEAKTKEAINREGFFATGDIGLRDEDGFFYITGRAKEILITAGGENVAPVPIEERIKTSLPCVSNAIVIGDKKKYLVAFLALKTLPEDPNDPDIPGSKLAPRALSWMREVAGSNANTIEDVIKLKDDRVFLAIQDGIDSANESAASNAATVKKWTLLPKDLSISGGELGATLKLKRHAFVEKYKKAIERMYE